MTPPAPAPAIRPAWRFAAPMVFLATAAATTGAGQEAAGPDRPNLVYILLDDAGYGDLGCYGQRQFATPHIDRLAEEGMRFTQHYAGSTVCAPTRSVLMTGLHTGHTPVRGNQEVQPVGQAPLPDATTTLPELLRAAGYATGAFGKWGLGFPGSEGAPENQGFDRFFGYNCQRNAHTYFPTWLYDDAERIELDGETYTHDLIMQKARDWVREQAGAGRPFFCFLPVTVPHAAMHVPEEDAAPFRGQFAQFEETVGRYAGTEFRNPAAAFAAMMTNLDSDIGELMSLLRETGADGNTVVMLSSDNGPHREGGHVPDFFDSNGPLRGYKRDLYEGGIRAPLIARWPGHIGPGTTTNLPSAHWDVLPTLCALAGADTPAPLDGVSLVPTLTGSGTQATHPYLYWEFYEREGSRAARFGTWKAVQRGLNKSADPPVEIYDLATDPGESLDVASQNPAAVARARAIFAEAHQPSALGWRWKGQATE